MRIHWCYLLTGILLLLIFIAGTTYGIYLVVTVSSECYIESGEDCFGTCGDCLIECDKLDEHDYTPEQIAFCERTSCTSCLYYDVNEFDPNWSCTNSRT
jgi:hypothetical protein